MRKGRKTNRIVCPNCQKQVDKKAEVELPGTTAPAPVTYGNLVLREDKQFLVLECVVTCPYCKEHFMVDIWLPTALPE